MPSAVPPLDEQPGSLPRSLGDQQSDDDNQGVEACLAKDDLPTLLVFPAATVLLPIAVFWVWTFANPASKIQTVLLPEPARITATVGDVPPALSAPLPGAHPAGPAIAGAQPPEPAKTTWTVECTTTLAPPGSPGAPPSAPTIASALAPEPAKIPSTVGCTAIAFSASPGTPPSAPQIAGPQAMNALNSVGRSTFRGAHLLTLAVSWFAILASLEILRRFIFALLKINPSQLETMDSSARDRFLQSGPGRIASHRKLARIVWDFGVAGLLLGAFWADWFAFVVRWLSGRLPFETAIRFVVSLAAGNSTTDMKHTLRAAFSLGAQSGLAAATLLIFAAAAIGFRWAKIGVVWYKPEDLARQRSWLITFFVLASALLVVSSGAIRAAQDWPLSLVDPQVRRRRPEAC